jgi:dienelactone hydrolase
VLVAYVLEQITGHSRESYIEDVARRLAVADFIAFASDGLTPVGGYPGDDEQG